MSAFATPTTRAPAFAGVRARPGQRYAVEWVKKRLRQIYRDARAAGRASPLNEAAAHLYLLIATYVLDRRFISEPMPVQELTGIMHCDAKTVRLARKRLTNLGELKLIDGGQGKAEVRCALVKMAGPLYAEQGGAPAPARAPTSGVQTEVTSGVQTEVLRAHGPKYEPTSGVQTEVADDHLSSLVEEVRSTTSAESAGIIEDSMTLDEQRAALEAAVARNFQTVHQFCDWWPEAYRAHNDGVQNRVRQSDRDAAEWLAGGRSLNRLQAMAIELWSLRGNYSRSDAYYITVTSDRSICVLLQKATIIEREVVRLGLDTPDEGPSAEGRSPDLYTDAEEQRVARYGGLAGHLERIRERLHQAVAHTSSASLAERLTSIARKLSAFDVDGDRAAERLEALDAEMLQAAQAEADADADRLQAEAEESLAAYRGRMHEEAYQRARHAAIERVLRDHFRLPVLIWDGLGHGRSTGTRQPAERTA